MCNNSDIFAGLDHDINLDADPAPVKGADMRGQLTTAPDALKFLRAGNATVTLASKKTGARFTYRISVSDDGLCHFVGLLVGQNNESDYKYLGRISRDIFWLGRKVPRPGDVSRDAPSAKAFDWAWRALVRGTLPEQLEIWTEGRCGRCGRKLTVPTSVHQGFGPECITRI
jgi:hypothetical protein